MSLFKCKMCGGTLEIEDKQTVATCEYCGTQQTVPTSVDENLQSVYNRANTLRIKSEFDKAEKLYEKACEYANPKGKNIIDLYCGAGTIGLSMAGDAKSIIGVEIIPQAIEDAKYNAKINGIKNARFICADATDAAKQLANDGVTCDVVVVDPPRKGCSAEVINTIAKDFKPKDVVYVSCDSATLARDIKMFSENGYVLKEYTPCDLFPRTSHVETVALLERHCNE